MEKLDKTHKPANQVENQD